MGKIRYIIAIWAAKFSILLLKITGHSGTNFPGIVAIKICPNFIKCAKKPKRIIAITGTNGKTTVSNMVLDLLSQKGYKILNNKAGSNIDTGIATSLINGMTLFGREKYEMAVFEVDERSALRIYPYMTPDYMLITNLSRDSIMRNGHPIYIRDFLAKYIPESTKLILNADDLISSLINLPNEKKFFGIERMEGDIEECTNLINDFQICPVCKNKLKYEYLRYNHIGKAYCPVCGFKSPKYDYAGVNMSLTDMKIEIRDESGSAEYRLLNESVFNIYNVVSVVALLRTMSMEHEEIQELFKKLNIVESRFMEEKRGNLTMYKLLAKEKNAFATTRVFDYISRMDGDKEIILMNSCQGDMKHWSENTCWLYDCDFEFLNRENIKNIILCGPRRFDHKLRLLLAGVDEDRISFSETELKAVEKLKLFDNDNIYVLYGTDSLLLGDKVSKQVVKLMEERVVKQ